MSLTAEEVRVVRARLETWPWNTLRRWYDDLPPGSDKVTGRMVMHISEHG